MGRAKYDCIKQKQSKNILETPYEKDLTKKGKHFLYFLENLRTGASVKYNLCFPNVFILCLLLSHG